MKFTKRFFAFFLVLIFACGGIIINFGNMSNAADNTDQEEKVFKILLIGNSYSEDASDWSKIGYASQTYKIFKSLCEDDVSIKIGLMASDGKTVAWHATQADKDAKSYTLRLTDENGIWYEATPVRTIKKALAYDDWDIVVIQPTSTESSHGYAEVKGGEYEFDEKFTFLEDSIPYFLDLCAEYAPGAAMYNYMRWVTTVSTSLNAEKDLYPQLTEMANTILTYEGKNSGKKIEGIIEVGTAIQNARSTYLARLYHEYGVSPPNNYVFAGDYVVGLQRDKSHLSFNVGRYIAGLTFAKTLLPKEYLKEGAVDCGMRASPDEEVGTLPAEYVEIARKAVENMIANPFSITEIEGYKDDPAKIAKTAISGETFIIEDAGLLRETLLNRISELIDEDERLSRVREDIKTDLKNIDLDFKNCESGGSFKASVSVRFGYTKSEFEIKGTIKQGAHAQRNMIAIAPTCTEKGYIEHICPVCGDKYSEVFCDELGHKIVECPHVSPTCTTNGLSSGEYCSVCKEVFKAQITIPAFGHYFSNMYTIDSDPTQTSPGLESRHCLRCEATIDEKQVPCLADIILGDLDFDEDISFKDVLIERKTVAGIISLNYAESLAADIDRDKDITLRDVLLIRRIVAGVLELD